MIHQCLPGEDSIRLAPFLSLDPIFQRLLSPCFTGEAKLAHKDFACNPVLLQYPRFADFLCDEGLNGHLPLPVPGGLLRFGLNAGLYPSREDARGRRRSPWGPSLKC